MRVISCVEAIREATEQLLNESDSYYIIGEGVPDPKACFGTTARLQEKFPLRVFDMPVSENGITGVAIGSALLGMRPIMVHMRIDFLMYAMDQLVNNAAKWYSMFGGQRSVPLVVRAFIGRGWGQGQQHSQNLEAMFAHVPGLKVVTPSNAYNAKGLLIAAARDNNPVIVIEHRWVHSVTSEVPEEMYEVEIGKSHVVQIGQDITIVAWGYMVIEARKACEALALCGIAATLIDVLTLSPMDMRPILDSVSATGKLLVVNEAWRFGGLAGEIIAEVYDQLKEVEATRLTNPSFPSPSTHGLTKHYYNDYTDIALAAGRLVGKKVDIRARPNPPPHDVPNPEFKGPF